MPNFTESFPEYQESMLGVLFSKDKLKEKLLLVLKEYFSKIQHSMPKNTRKICRKTIHNLEKIVKKPTTPHFISGGQRSFSVCHKDGTPFTKKELEELNYIESIPETHLGYPQFPTCQFCHKPLVDPYGNRITNRSKCCSDNCSANYRRLNKKRKEIGASIIWIKETKDNPPGQKPFWKDMEATYEVKLKTKTKYITKKLPAKKGKGYNKIKFS